MLSRVVLMLETPLQHLPCTKRFEREGAEGQGGGHRPRVACQAHAPAL